MPQHPPREKQQTCARLTHSASRVGGYVGDELTSNFDDGAGGAIGPRCELPDLALKFLAPKSWYQESQEVNARSDGLQKALFVVRGCSIPAKAPGHPGRYCRDPSKPRFLFRTEQPYQRRLDPYRLYRELAPWRGFFPDPDFSPRLGFFPDSVLDRSQLLVFSLLIAAPFGPLLATINPPLFRGPLHVGVPRLGQGLFGGSSLLGSSLLVRRCLGCGSCGLRRRNCRL